MHNISTIKSLQDTTLYKRLEAISTDSDRPLCSNLVTVCAEAEQQTKLIFTHFPQYTLHDGDHLLRVTEIISLVAGSTLNSLNSLEICILILAAHFHDIGMAPTQEELSEYLKSEDFLYYKETWIANHPNYIELSNALSGGELSILRIDSVRRSLSEMDQAIITAYLREIHAGQGLDNFAKKYINDRRLEFKDVNIIPYVVQICKSHAMDAALLTPANGFNYDEDIGHLKVNMAYLAVLLRLADIMDFDRERTPDVLYNSIHFTSAVSLQEWEKHRGVVGWSIDSNAIRYSMQFEHPVYENAARKFLGAIDQELQNCHTVCGFFPANFQHYKLCLPLAVDKSRIGAKNNSYISFDLAFSLNREEIVKLLLTHNLYQSPSICVRELLQNSADAIRLRSAQFGEGGITWSEGQISFEHFVNQEGIEILKCTDNGCGMDEDIIRNYFTKVGKSYYKSPEFLQKRIRLREHNTDFDPCSQFGIGFMSCFMIGDKIEIMTRRDYGQGISYGKPIEVEINGTGGIITIREGKNSQPIGTTIIIHSRKKPDFYDVWTDRIRLATVLKGYALAIEYPIHIKTKIPEIATEYTVKKDVIVFPPLVEKLGVSGRRNHKIYFKDLDSDLGGYIEEAFIVDEQKRYSIENSEAAWTVETTSPTSKRFVLARKNDTGKPDYGERHISVCMDGILVSGSPGRPAYGRNISHMLGWRNPNIDSHASCCIDIRGSLKPEITPARVPPERSGFDSVTPKWRRIQDIVYKANGSIWDKVAEDLHTSNQDFEVFWKLGKVYSTLFTTLSYPSILNYVPLPFATGQTFNWRFLRDITQLDLSETIDAITIDNGNAKLLFPTSLIEWESSGEDRPNLNSRLISLAISVCNLGFENEIYKLFPDLNHDPSRRPFEYIYFSRFQGACYALNYSSNISKYVSVNTPFRSINRQHPLYSILFESKYVSTRSNLQEFAHSFLTGISDFRLSSEGRPNLNDRWKKYIGCKYKSINWNDIAAKYRAPYFIKTGAYSEFSVAEEIFLEWSKLELRNEFYEDPIDD